MSAPSGPSMERLEWLYDLVETATSRLASGQCPARACRRSVPYGRLACAEHWAALPVRLRRLINVTWTKREQAPADLEVVEAHERRKAQAFLFWETGTWSEK